MMKLIIKENRMGPLINRHPWAFSKAFTHIPDGLAPGEAVSLYSERGRFIGCGYFSSYSQIAVRLWGFDEDEKVDERFFIKRIERAYALRKRFVESPSTNAFRLIHGENDLLPGLIVDKYGEYLVVQFHTRGIEAWKGFIVAAMEKVCSPKGIYERSDTSTRDRDGLGTKTGLLGGTVPDIITIKENGFSFLVDVKQGQKTGFFLDQRDKRRAFAGHARDAYALNCFSYTGGFSVYALAGGATGVVNVDTSERALELARENVSINGLDRKRCEFVHADVKRYLRDTDKQFDAIVLDPPAFIKDRRKREEGIMGYRTINEMAINVLGDNGLLVTCSCSTHLSLEEFRYLLTEAGGRSGKTLTFVETYTHGADHPCLLPFTEGDYLKCFFVVV